MIAFMLFDVDSFEMHWSGVIVVNCACRILLSFSMESIWVRPLPIAKTFSFPKCNEEHSVGSFIGLMLGENDETGCGRCRSAVKNRKS